jgi:hypothetical protein
MKNFLVGLLLIASINPVLADDYVNGHYRQNGTYVQPYVRSNSNYTQYDNYSTKGNYNPYSGDYGTINVNTPSHNYGYNNRY